MRPRNKWFGDKDMLWVDKRFLMEMKEIELERLKRNKPKINMGNLTSKLIRCPSYKNLKSELINDIEDPNNDINFNLKIKFDKRRLLR